MVKTNEDDWHKLYGESWSGVITPEAFQHPAKFSRALIRRIYTHAKYEGWISEHDAVVDCFGGVALGAFDALRMGLDWTGVELEQKFVELGSENIRLWNERYSRFPQWGNARLLQGDSRKLSEVIGESALCVSSPPFCDNNVNIGAVGDTPAKRQQIHNSTKRDQSYGATDGNLGNMRSTTSGFEMAVSSPPYIDSMERSNGIDASKIKSAYGQNSQAVNSTRYGTSDGQLGSMREGDHALCVTSPPYEHCSYHGLSKSFAEWREMNGRDNTKPGVQGVRDGYGTTKGQLAGSGSDFWSASRLILEQLHIVLSPRAHAIFVVKNFVRNKKIVPFTEQWAALCEAVGFRLIHHHKAYLVEHHGTQGTFDGEGSQIKTERKSFFRRLAESKGSPPIDYESVLCFEKAS